MKTKTKGIKIVFMGSADFSAPILLNLIQNFNVCGIITEPDKKAGRGLKLITPQTKLIATQNNIKCFQPTGLKNNLEIFAEIKKIEADVFITASFGKIIPQELLNIPPFGSINVHPSLLPKYRGASPIQNALLNGDKTTGITLFKMDSGMDTGDIIVQAELNIAKNDNYFTLEQKIIIETNQLINQTLLKYINNQITLIKQDDKLATYTQKIEKTNGLIDWSQSAEQIYNQYRAYIKWPGIFTYWQNKKLDLIELKPITYNHKLKAGEVFFDNNQVLIACGKNAIAINKVKLEGKKEMDVKTFLNGARDFVGSILTQQFNK